MPALRVSDNASAVVSGFYDAATNGDWSDVGRDLYRLFGVDSGSLRLPQNDGTSMNLFLPGVPAEAEYAKRFEFVDPIRAAATRLDPQGDWEAAVKTEEELIPAEVLHRSAFYQNFMRPHGQNHILIGALADRAHTVISFHRENAFTDDEKAMLVAMLPHLRQSVELHKRLRLAELKACVGFAAFEALPGGALVVDGNMDILFANAEAERILAHADSPIGAKNETGPVGANVRRLAVNDRRHAARLKFLIEDAASLGCGGVMKMDVESETCDRVDHLAIQVTPQPNACAARDGAAQDHGLALVMIRELARPSAPQASLLSDLFGFSLAEAAVALSLLGGQTAETVARERDVSLDTVRSQIRTVLRKSEAANLRDFERIGAVLATLAH